MSASRNPSPLTLRERGYWSGWLIGVGLMAGVDVIVFHQLLGWHHLYDRGPEAAGLASDGAVHLIELSLVVVGFSLLMRARTTAETRVVLAGSFAGLGSFQLFDAVVSHKLLRLHQVRYGVDPLPYDVAWLTSGVVLLAVGVLLTRPASPRGRRGG